MYLVHEKVVFWIMASCIQYHGPCPKSYCRNRCDFFNIGIPLTSACTASMLAKRKSFDYAITPLSKLIRIQRQLYIRLSGFLNFWSYIKCH